MIFENVIQYPILFSVSPADMKKRRFLQSLRGLRRIFRKKGRTAVISSAADGHAGVNGLHISNENLDFSEQTIDTNLEPAKSHSTSHLDDDQADNAHRRYERYCLLYFIVCTVLAYCVFFICCYD